MESDTITAASIASGTQRETFSVSVTPEDEKRFESEIRRTDAVVAEEKKSREKFETQIGKAVNDLHVEMNSRFEKMEKSIDTRFEKMEKSIDTRFEKVEKSIDTRFEKMEKSIDTRFEKVDARFDRMDDRLWWIFGAVDISILIPLATKYL
jgi:DNA anti-recombination protein RmuC